MKEALAAAADELVLHAKARTRPRTARSLRTRTSLLLLVLETMGTLHARTHALFDDVKWSLQTREDEEEEEEKELTELREREWCTLWMDRTELHGGRI